MNADYQDIKYLFHYTPYGLAEGGAHKWDEKREEIADAILGILRKQTTNMGSGNIIGRVIETPRVGTTKKWPGFPYGLL